MASSIRTAPRTLRYSNLISDLSGLTRTSSPSVSAHTWVEVPPGCLNPCPVSSGPPQTANPPDLTLVFPNYLDFLRGSYTKLNKLASCCPIFRLPTQWHAVVYTYRTFSHVLCLVYATSTLRFLDHTLRTTSTPKNGFAGLVKLLIQRLSTLVLSSQRRTRNLSQEVAYLSFCQQSCFCKS